MSQIPTPAQVAQVRGRYLAGDTVKSIAAATGIKSVDVLYRCLHGDFGDGSGAPLAPIARRRAGVRVLGRNGGSRQAIVRRLWRAAERQVEDIEERLKSKGLDSDERESNARTFATLARTLRDLSAFDEAKNSRKGKRDNDHEHDEPLPRNVDELRRSLAEKLEAFVARTTDRVSGGA